MPITGADLLLWAGIAGLLWLARREGKPERPDPEQTAEALIRAAEEGDADAEYLIALAKAILRKWREREDERGEGRE